MNFLFNSSVTFLHNKQDLRIVIKCIMQFSAPAAGYHLNQFRFNKSSLQWWFGCRVVFLFRAAMPSRNPWILNINKNCVWTIIAKNRINQIFIYFRSAAQAISSWPRLWELDQAARRISTDTLPRNGRGRKMKGVNGSSVSCASIFHFRCSSALQVNFFACNLIPRWWCDGDGDGDDDSDAYLKSFTLL